MEVLCFIPARGGSSGIKNKNIRPFAGRSLLTLAVSQAKQTSFITRVVVSTDSSAIARHARAVGVEVPYRRPVALATATSQVTDAVLHFLDYARREENYEPKYVVLLQATSPLRTVADLTGAWALLRRRRAPAVVSVCRTEPLLFTKNNRGRLAFASARVFLKSTNRQAPPPTYKLDGSMVYIIATKAFRRHHSFLPPGVLGYEVPRWRATDVDEPQDFVVGELLFKHQIALDRAIKRFR